MATINAQLALNSDISSSGLTINKTMQMKKARSTSGLEFTTGLAKRAFTNNNHVDLLTAGSGVAADVTASAGSPNETAAKLYIKNVGTDNSKFFTIGKGTSSGSTDETPINTNAGTSAYYTIGRLYGQDWMLIPWDAVSATGDITIQASDASASSPMHVEYMIFFE